MLAPQSAFGSGLTQDAALDSCLGESVERYSTVWQGTEPMVVGRQTDLPDAIPPQSILLYSERQYSTRHQWNATSRDLFKVPEPVDDKAAIHWSPVRSLRDGSRRLVPTALCYAGACGDPAAFCTADSIGCAAGRTTIEAQLNALLEVVERDAVAIWWYNRLTRPHLPLAGTGAEDIADLATAVRGIGKELTVLDVTHDVDIPVYVAVGAERDGTRPFFGAAAHPDARVAARKAIAELIQLWFWTTVSEPEAAFGDWLRIGDLATDTHLTSDSTLHLRKRYVGTTAEMLSWCVQRLAARDLEPYALDMTRPEAGLPVSRIIVPGARHCWNRLASGRLNDVPVSMGWRDRALREEELNPIGCPL